MLENQACTEPVLCKGNSKHRKSRGCQPWTLSNPPRQSERYQSCSCRTVMAFSGSASSTRTERRDDTLFVPDTVHGGMYPLAGRRYDIFEMVRKNRYWQFEMVEQYRKNTAFSSNYRLFLFTRISLGSTRPKDVSKRNNRLTDDGKLTVLLGLFRKNRSILANARQTH